MITSLQKYGFGILAVAASLLVWTAFTSCTKKATNYMYVPNSDTTLPPPATTPTNLRMLALGDSYTIGESVAEADRFPNQTITLLKAKGINLSYPATIIARTGWTTANLLDAIKTGSPQPSGTYDAVTLLIGVNNQYQHRDTAEYRLQFIECLDRALGFAGGNVSSVFVVSIPDYGATPYGASNAAQIGKEVDQFNAIAKQVTLAKSISFTDITPSSRQATTDATLVAGDGLHPSGKEYAKWAQMLEPKLAAVLK